METLTSRYVVGMTEELVPAEKDAAIRKMAERYLWWKAIGAELHSQRRTIAQLMRFGTYADIRTLETTLSPAILATVMNESAPGWFDDRSWGFWRGRLAFDGQNNIREQRPLRSFADASLL